MFFVLYEFLNLDDLNHLDPLFSVEAADEVALEVTEAEEDGGLLSVSYILLFLFDLSLSLVSIELKSAIEPVPNLLNLLDVNLEGMLCFRSFFSLSFSRTTGTVVLLDDEELFIVGLAVFVLLYFAVAEEAMGTLVAALVAFVV